MFSIAMEEEPKVMLHHDPEKHKVGLHSLSRISQGLTYAEIVELCKNAKVQFGKEASLREFERAVLKLTEKPAINRKDLELVEEESRTFARGHPFEYQTNLNNAIDNEFGRILVYAELEEAPVGPGRDCAIYIKVVNLTDFELENVEMIYRSEDLDPNYKGKGRESLYGKTIFNNIETCYGRISFKENKIQPNDDRDYTLHHRLKNYYMLNKKEREYIRLLTYLTADIRVKLSDSQSLGRYFVRPGSFIAKTVRVPSDEEQS